jgi:DNA-binding beta-propeller fold protein YncE
MLLGATTSWRAIVCDPGTSELYPIDLPLNQPPSAESPLAGIPSPQFVVITPDATRAIVTNDAEPSASNVFSLNLTTNPISIATSTSLENGSLALALTPDGEKTYVADENGDIKVLKTSDLSSITTIPNSEFESARARVIAISPTRPEAYVTTITSSKVFVINTNTNHVTGSFDLSVVDDPNAIAITPTGSEVYVVNYNPTNIFYITLSDGTVNTITGMSPQKMHRV